MVRATNCIVGFLNLLTLIASIALVCFSLFLQFHGATACGKVIQLPLLIVGASLCVVSLMGLFGSFCRVTFFSAIYQFILFVIILGLAGFTIFSFVVTNKSAGDMVSRQGYESYRLGDYSHWLQQRVSDAANWEKIKACLNDATVCQSLGHDAIPAAANFFKKNLASVQSGCCKPPAYCGFTSVNATLWTIPKAGPAAPDPDCKTWSNDQDRLCYDCTSCKVGFLSSLRSQWRKIAIINIGALALLIIIYSCGCCAYRNNKQDNSYKGYRGPYPYH
ncbi:tetraspanin-8-like [Aristolochia californica]|uniref:tetraspanin-8-like n=1 Tax=Aristolochia californica TaxID=171875 RepID=UPI0035D5B025